MRAEFGLIDRDHDGRISREEFMRVRQEGQHFQGGKIFFGQRFPFQIR